MARSPSCCCLTVKRRDWPFPAVLAMFAVSIVACGTTHALDIWTIWHPAYWISGAAKVVTAIASLATFALLVRIVPTALAMKSAEELSALNRELNEKNRLLEMSEQMTRIAPWRIDLRTGELIWSEEIYSILGRPLTYQPELSAALGFYHPDDRAHVTATIENAKMQGTAFAYNARILHADGSYRDVTCSGQAERSANGVLTGVFGVFQDITERKMIERERERLLERVVVAAQAARAGIWEYSITTKTLSWDPTMYALYGVLDQQFSPTLRTWIAQVHDDDRAQTEREMTLAASTGAPFENEFRTVWPSGEVHNIEL